jgi:hypothetical protein
MSNRRESERAAARRLGSPRRDRGPASWYPGAASAKTAHGVEPPKREETIAARMLEEAGELTRRQGLSPDQPSDHGAQELRGRGDVVFQTRGRFSDGDRNCRLPPWGAFFRRRALARDFLCRGSHPGTSLGFGRAFRASLRRALQRLGSPHSQEEDRAEGRRRLDDLRQVRQADRSRHTLGPGHIGVQGHDNPGTITSATGHVPAAKQRVRAGRAYQIDVCPGSGGHFYGARVKYTYMSAGS